MVSGLAQARAEQYLFSHLAGPPGGSGDADGIGPTASFNRPYGVATDSAGNVYVADWGNYAIRKVTPNGTVTTLYRATRFSYEDAPLTPLGVAVDAAGIVYVADQSNNTFKIRKINPDGTLGSSVSTGLDYDGSIGLAVDRTGNVYFCSTFYHTVGKVSPDGVISTLAGSKNLFGSADGTGAEARFRWPDGLALDAAGNLYVTDNGNVTIRRITPGGVVTTLAGLAGESGASDGTGPAARFDSPYGLAVDRASNIYVGEGRMNTIRKVTTGGVVTTLAGSTGLAGSADGTGPTARFNFLNGLAVDDAGTIYAADGDNESIRRITGAGLVTTLAGATGVPGSADGTGPSARFNAPRGTTVDNQGNVYVADWNNHTIRRITPGGVVSTLAGTPGQSGGTDGTGASASFNFPNSVAVDGSGNVFVSEEGGNTIRKITPQGLVSTLAGTYGKSGSADGSGGAARFNGPKGLAVDSSGNIYVADYGNKTIRKITPAGSVTTLAGTAGAFGNVDATGAAARFSDPIGVAVDAGGNVYVTAAPGQIPPFSSSAYPAASGNTTIRKITPAGVVTTLAGSAGQRGEVDGVGSAARFDGLNGLTVDQTGNVFATEASGAVRKITPAGVVTTMAGSTVHGHADGLGSIAQFNQPNGLAIDNTGNLYVVDSGNNSIRKGVLAGPPVISAQPQSQSVASGGSVQFSVTAGGVPDPTYQWYFNGTVFNGGTSSSLSFSNARSTDAGDYTVVVTNALGAVTSAKATLTVSAASTPSSSGAGSGGGGGAPSPGFILALITLAALRRLRAGCTTWR